MSQARNYESAPTIVIKSLFDKYDNDKNGKLNKDELYALLENDLGMTEEQAQIYLHLLDKDGDGCISYKEFETWFRSGEHLQSITNLTRFYYLKKAVEFFKKYDLDDNGAIDRKEFGKLFEDFAKNGEQTMDAFMDALDLDKNGLISFEELARWLHWLPPEEFLIIRKKSMDIERL